MVTVHTAQSTSPPPTTTLLVEYYGRVLNAAIVHLHGEKINPLDILQTLPRLHSATAVPAARPA